MKKFKFLLVVSVFAFTVTASLALRSDDSGTFDGAKVSTCPTPQTMNEGQCYSNSTGAQCTITGTTEEAWIVGECLFSPLRVNPN